MENNKFFQTLWRFNAVLIALMGLLAIGVLCVGLLVLIPELKRKHYKSPDTASLSLNNADYVEKFWLSSTATPITGTTLVKIPLYSNQARVVKSYGEKKPEPTRNIAFVNTQTKEKRWLFDINDYMIFDHDIIIKNDATTPHKKVATWYKVYKSDTDGDGKITYSGDTFSLAISTPDGRNYKELIDGVNYHIVDMELASPNKIYLIYMKRVNKKSKHFISTVNISNFSLESTVEFPEILIKNPKQ